MLPPSACLCLIGFGEVGRSLGTELAARGCALRSHDPLLDNPATRATLQQRIEDAGIHAAATLAEALRGAKLVICTLDAAEAADVIRSAAALLQRGQIFLDLSEVSAAGKQFHAALIEASGADYVDAALPVAAALAHLAMPMQLGGPRAAELAPALNALGFDTCAVSVSAGFERAAIANTSAAAPPTVRVAPQPRRGELP